METKMAELLLADEAEEARETPEPPPNAKPDNNNEGTSAEPGYSKAEQKTGAKTMTKTGGIDAFSNDDAASAAVAAKSTPPPTVKISGVSPRSNGDKSPVDAISTWSEEGCHVFMPNWGETSSTNVSLLGTCLA